MVEKTQLGLYQWFCAPQADSGVLVGFATPLDIYGTKWKTALQEESSAL
jgi:hypothetical protein